MCGFIMVSLKVFHVTEKKDIIKHFKYYINKICEKKLFFAVLLMNREWIIIALHTTILVIICPAPVDHPLEIERGNRKVNYTDLDFCEGQKQKSSHTCEPNAGFNSWNLRGTNQHNHNMYLIYNQVTSLPKTTWMCI